ncbi:hypothetical protein HBB16_05910 [Pseudonocardia sp. MCCB 268]|nr:hypothetical protein [Pseudonocardia cytotoxica]
MVRHRGRPRDRAGVRGRRAARASDPGGAGERPVPAAVDGLPDGTPGRAAPTRGARAGARAAHGARPGARARPANRGRSHRARAGPVPCAAA